MMIKSRGKISRNQILTHPLRNHQLIRARNGKASSQTDEALTGTLLAASRFTGTQVNEFYAFEILKSQLRGKHSEFFLLGKKGNKCFVGIFGRGHRMGCQMNNF